MLRLFQLLYQAMYPALNAKFLSIHLVLTNPQENHTIFLNNQHPSFSQFK